MSFLTYWQCRKKGHPTSIPVDKLHTGGQARCKCGKKVTNWYPPR